MKAPDVKPVEVSRALHHLHVLLRAHRLYEKNHPSILENLDTTYDLLRGIAGELNGLEIRVERGGLVVPKLGDAHLADARGELQVLAADLQRSGVRSLIFAKKFNVGELDTLAHLTLTALLRSEEPAKRGGLPWWPAKLLENRVEGILVNEHTERRVDTVLASLIAALVAYGGNSPRENSDTAIQAPEIDDLVAALRLLARRGSRALDPRCDGRSQPRDRAHAAQRDHPACSAGRGKSPTLLAASLRDSDL